jgi:uncharacterized protein YdaU (DUF1376 family)
MGDPYYPWFQGDYMRDTSDLSLAEDGAYRRLLDHYYSEEHLPADKSRLYRVCRVSSSEENAAVDFVVKRYFTVEGDRLVNSRAEKELAKRRKFIDDQKRKSVLGHAARWGKEMPVGTLGACPEVCPDDAPPSPSPDQDQLPIASARVKKPPAPPHSETEEIYFSRIDEFFKALTNGNLDEWGKAYPAIPLEVELQRARMWLKANPAKRKKNLQRFVVNWLAHAQERGGMSYGRRTECHVGESRTAGVREKYAGR